MADQRCSGRRVQITFNDEREQGPARAIRDRRPALPPVLGCFPPRFGLLYQQCWDGGCEDAIFYVSNLFIYNLQPATAVESHPVSRK